MSNVSKGHNFEREVKKMFTDAGWFCTRAAASQSPMDLIAYTNNPCLHMGCIYNAGYEWVEFPNKPPFDHCYKIIVGRNIKKIYYIVVRDPHWTVVLMQCKIKKRRRAKAR